MNIFLFCFTTTVCVSISSFASLIGIPTGIKSSMGLKICAIIAGTKTYKSIIRKKKKKHFQIVFLAKSKLNSIEVLFSRSLINSLINHDEFALLKNLLKQYNEMKEENKNLKT